MLKIRTYFIFLLLNNIYKINNYSSYLSSEYNVSVFKTIIKDDNKRVWKAAFLFLELWTLEK